MRGKRFKNFDLGDELMVHFWKELFIVNLSSDYGISKTFSVQDLFLYHDPDALPLV